MRFYFQSKAVYLVASMICIALTGKAQNTRASNEVIVTAEITGSGLLEAFDKNVPGFDKDIPGLFVKLTVRNHSKKPKQFVTMSCSWQNNWQTDNKSLVLWYSVCEKNTPYAISLKPEKSIVFYGFLTRKIISKNAPHDIKYGSPQPSHNKKPAPLSDGKVRFAFSELYQDEFKSLRNKGRKTESMNHTNKMWWSNPVSLQFNNNTFIVEE
jgi:hypothetical protein